MKPYYSTCHGEIDGYRPEHFKREEDVIKYNSKHRREKGEKNPVCV